MNVRQQYGLGHPVCEARVKCQGARTDHIHEPLTRARGGRTDDIENMLAVCWACHRWIHDNPREATERGFLRSAYGQH